MTTTIYVKLQDGTRREVERIEHNPYCPSDFRVAVYSDNEGVKAPNLDYALTKLAILLDEKRVREPPARSEDDTRRVLHEDADKKVTIKP